MFAICLQKLGFINSFVYKPVQIQFYALTCKKGGRGYVSLRHNWLRDTIGKLFNNVNCKDVQIDPTLLPDNGQTLPIIVADQARLDISARSVWNACERAFFDVRVFHPLARAPSNADKTPRQMYFKLMTDRENGPTMQESCELKRDVSLHLSLPRPEEWEEKLNP
jgi:hypothetical protein